MNSGELLHYALFGLVTKIQKIFLKKLVIFSRIFLSILINIGLYFYTIKYLYFYTIKYKSGIKILILHPKIAKIIYQKSFWIFIICSEDVKNKKKRKVYWKWMCCLYCIYECFFFNDKIAKNKEEFIILICSRLRIMNLHVSCISNIWWKNKIFKTSLSHQSHEATYLK